MGGIIAENRFSLLLKPDKDIDLYPVFIIQWGIFDYWTCWKLIKIKALSQSLYVSK